MCNSTEHHPVQGAKPHGTVTYRVSNTCIDSAINDPFLQWVARALRSQFEIGGGQIGMEQSMECIEQCISDHIKNPDGSKISHLKDGISFITPLPVLEAFKMMDTKYRITRRKHIPPSLHECRQILNLAQVLQSASNLKLITFDGDETLYPNGTNFDDPKLAEIITLLIKEHKLTIALVTAAGYGNDPAGYTMRLGGLLTHFAEQRLSAEDCTRFYVFGGESNYLFRLKSDCTLECVPYCEWEKHCCIGFTPERELECATKLLKVASKSMLNTIEDLGLRADMIRKERAVGLIPGGLEGMRRQPHGSGAKRIRPEILEEVVARVREAVDREGGEIGRIPFCAFNGGTDVWVDVGNKAIALSVLQSLLNIKAHECVHIGDQFSESGNDITVREKSPCIWVVNPTETKAILRRTIRELEKKASPKVSSSLMIDEEDEI